MSTVKPQINHLFRPMNLIIIIVTMYLLKFGLFEPMLHLISGVVELEMTSQMDIVWFTLLVLSVVLIAAGGYVLNDIKDVETDKINGSANPIGSLISIEIANKLYQGVTVVGLILGFVIGYKFGNYNYGIIQLTAAISLWFYSNYFKSEFLSGNLVVAFVLALVPLTVGIYEVSLVQIEYFNKVTVYKDFNFNFIAYWFLAYSVFVFVLTLIREMEKDIEDIVGDKQTGGRTLPIVWGVPAAKGVISFLYVLIIASLIYVRMEYLVDNISGYFIAMVGTLLLFNIIHLWMNRVILFKVSNWSKIISVIGVLYLYALGYIINNQLFFNV